MKISVVTVSYNSGRTIGDTLSSVIAQDYPHVEHVVIDGASRDETLEVIAREGKHVASLVSEPDNGIYDAMNKGIRRATGEVVGFLNSDDVYAHAGVLSSIAGVMADTAVDAVYGDLVFVGGAGAGDIVRYWSSRPYESGLVRKGWMPPHPTFYVRRALLDAVGGFDQRYALAGDFDLCLRLFEVRRIRAVYLPQIMVRMRMGGATTGSLRNIVRGNLEAAQACRRQGFPGGPGFIARKLLSKVPQLVRRPGQRRA